MPRFLCRAPFPASIEIKKKKNIHFRLTNDSRFDIMELGTGFGSKYRFSRVFLWKGGSQMEAPPVNFAGRIRF